MRTTDIRVVLFIVATLIGCAPTGPSAPLCSSALATTSLQNPRVARAVEVVKGVHSNKRDAVYAGFSESFRRHVSLEAYHKIDDEIDTADGKLTDAFYAGWQPNPEPGWDTIRIVAVFERGAEVYSISLDDKQVVRGLTVHPLAPPNGAGATPSAGPAEGYVAKRTYRLPGTGAWHVGKDGHAGNPQQWYALDLEQEGTDGKRYKDDGKKNEDYAAFGQRVLAPADGTIITIVDGVPDNAPGEENHYVLPGNYVVIDHGDGEYSVIAHIEHGSFVVKTGAHVKAGDELAKVGNSGNSSEPHIHWGLTSDPQIEKGHGLPIRFAQLLVNGKAVDAPQPVRDDRLEAVH